MTKRFQVHQGDIVRVLPLLPDESAHALLTDPPYSSGGSTLAQKQKSTKSKYMSSGIKTNLPSFAGDARDQRSYFLWCVMWMSECYRILQDGASACVFTDWRQLSTIEAAMQAADFSFRGIVPWDKGRGSRPMRGGFRRQAEFVVWCTKGEPLIREEVYLDGVLRHSSVPSVRRIHQTEKPLSLIGEMLQIVPKAGVVLDPFAGSGAIGEAVIVSGRNYIGVEKVKHYHQVASNRLNGVAIGKGK